MFLYQSHVLLLEFAGQRRVLVGVASRVVELVLPSRLAAVHRVGVHDHVVGATLEAETLLILVGLRRLRGLPVMLLELLAPSADQLVVVLRVNDYLMRIVAIVAAVQYLILVLNLIVVRQLRRVVDAYLAAALPRILERVVGVARGSSRWYRARGGGIRTVQPSTVAPSAYVADHLSIVELGLNLAAFVRSVQHILPNL